MLCIAPGRKTFTASLWMACPYRCFRPVPTYRMLVWGGWALATCGFVVLLAGVASMQQVGRAITGRGGGRDWFVSHVTRAAAAAAGASWPPGLRGGGLHSLWKAAALCVQASNAALQFPQCVPRTPPSLPCSTTGLRLLRPDPAGCGRRGHHRLPRPTLLQPLLSGKYSSYAIDTKQRCVEWSCNGFP